MYHSVETIIFDLGGVILNLDYQATLREFSQLAGREVTTIYSKASQHTLFDDFETGQITPEAFRHGIRELLQLTCSDAEIDHAWNAMLLDLPPNRIAFLQELSRRKPIYLFSNTNAIHKEAFNQIFRRSYPHITGGIDSLFVEAFYSHQVGKRKPHPETFQFVVEKHGLNPASTLFIDDSPQHVEGARAAGLLAHHLTDSECITRLGL